MAEDYLLWPVALAHYSDFYFCCEQILNLRKVIALSSVRLQIQSIRLVSSGENDKW